MLSNEKYTGNVRFLKFGKTITCGGGCIDVNS